jgi:outer membrane protein TolC
VLVPLLLVGCTPFHTVRPPSSSPREYDEEVAQWTASLDHPLLEPMPVDPADGFDPDEVALIAVVTNPSLQTARDRRQIAHSQVVAAGLLPNPQLQFQTYFPVAGKTEGSLPGYTGQLTWSIGSLLRRSLEMDAAELSEQSVELDIAWSEWRVALQTQLLAYQILLLKEARAIHQANIAKLEATRSLVGHAAAEGTVPAARLASVESALSLARTASATTQRQMASREARLRGMLGGLQGVVEHLRGEVEPPQGIEDLSEEALAAHLADRRPDLKAMRMAVRSRSAAFQAATRRAFPSIQVGFQVARDPGGFVALGPVFQVGIPVFDHGQAGRASAQAQSDRLGDLFAERLNEARQRIGVALAGVRGSQAVLVIIGEAIARQEHLVEIYQEALGRGTVDVLVYYTARSALIQLRLQRVVEQALLWKALIELRTESASYHLPGTGKSGKHAP